MNSLKETIDNLSQNKILKGLLVDKGFFSEYNWQYVGSGYYVAKKRCHLDTWEYDRRFIFIRHEKLIEPKNKDQNRKKQKRFCC